jgi:hypothetical protein
MNVTKLSLVPFQKASLCLDCDMITTGHTHCFACGSTALLNLARTLNGGDYARPLPGTLSAVGISASRGFESLGVPGAISGRPRRFAGESAAFVEMSPVMDAETRPTNRWYLLRGVATAVQRAMTVAVIGFIVVAVAMQAHG